MNIYVLHGEEEVKKAVSLEGTNACSKGVALCLHTFSRAEFTRSIARIRKTGCQAGECGEPVGCLSCLTCVLLVHIWPVKLRKTGCQAGECGEPALAAYLVCCVSYFYIYSVHHTTLLTLVTLSNQICVPLCISTCMFFFYVRCTHQASIRQLPSCRHLSGTLDV